MQLYSGFIWGAFITNCENIHSFEFWHYYALIHIYKDIMYVYIDCQVSGLVYTLRRSVISFLLLAKIFGIGIAYARHTEK